MSPEGVTSPSSYSSFKTTKNTPWSEHSLVSCVDVMERVRLHGEFHEAAFLATGNRDKDQEIRSSKGKKQLGWATGDREVGIKPEDK